MKNRRAVTLIAASLLIGAFVGSVGALRLVEDTRGKQATLEEILYVPSAKTLKRMSLGYSGLLADIYWTRAVQYYGGKHLQAAPRYDLLYPLLDITTDLDPHLIIAYQFGSIFLSQKPPAGAGQPEKAVALVEKGIRANPDWWQLYYTLGFIHYWDRKDYKAAAEAFRKGAENPKALYWMKIMAATMAERAHDPNTAILMWKGIYDSVEDKMVRENAIQHMNALIVDRDVSELGRRITLFREKTGRLPSSWNDLIRESLLGGIPVDPARHPYKLMPDGTVQVQNPEGLPFITRGLAPDTKKSTK